jgi:hypothetical protein
MPTQASRRLRQALRRAQAGPGSPRQPPAPSGRLRACLHGAHAQVRPYGSGHASGHAQARSRPAPGTLKHAQAAQTRPGAPQEGAHAQEGTDTLKKAHQARSSTLRQAQDGPARSGMSTTAQARSGRFRQAQTRLRHAQTRSETSDRLRYAR